MKMIPGKYGGSIIQSEPGEATPGAGRPKGSPNRTTVTRMVLNLLVELPDANKDELAKLVPQTQKIKHSAEFIVAIMQLHKAIQGDTAAYKALLDSAYGAPKQEVETTITEKTAREMTNEELDEAVEKALAEIDQQKQIGSS